MRVSCGDEVLANHFSRRLSSPGNHLWLGTSGWYGFSKKSGYRAMIFKNKRLPAATQFFNHTFSL